LGPKIRTGTHSPRQLFGTKRLAHPCCVGRACADYIFSTSQLQVGPYGTVPNNGTYKPPTVGGGTTGGPSGSASNTGTRTNGGSAPTTTPGDGAAGLQVGFAAAFMGLAAMFL